MTLLTTQQVADALGIQPTSVRKLVERGKLTARRYGVALMFAPRDVARAGARPGKGRPVLTGGKAK